VLVRADAPPEMAVRELCPLHASAGSPSLSRRYASEVQSLPFPIPKGSVVEAFADLRPAFIRSFEAVNHWEKVAHGDGAARE